VKGEDAHHHPRSKVVYANIRDFIICGNCSGITTNSLPFFRIKLAACGFIKVVNMPLPVHQTGTHTPSHDCLAVDMIHTA
jgi:hypothetical protein